MIVGVPATMLSYQKFAATASKLHAAVALAVLTIPISAALLIPVATANPLLTFGHDILHSATVGYLLGFGINAIVALVVGWVTQPLARSKGAYVAAAFVVGVTLVVLYAFGIWLGLQMVHYYRFGE